MAQASNLVPLVILLFVLALMGAVGFIAWSVASDVSDKAAQRMGEKNIKFSKDGMKVGMKEISTEDVSDSTQSYVINSWSRQSWTINFKCD